jgi:hypothetical protein
MTVRKLGDKVESFVMRTKVSHKSISARAFFPASVGLIVLVFSLIGVEAQAISRYTSTSMSCASIRSTIQSEGAVILQWRSSQGNPRYDRFVANSSFCDRNKRAVVATVPSSDKKSCSVKICRRCERDDDQFFFPLRPC